MVGKYLLVVLVCGAPIAGRGQAILHYTETSGFDHGTREESLVMFQQIADAIGAVVVDDPDGSQFNSLSGLEQFDVVVFSNTSGDAILAPAQRANFEAYIAQGGSVLGIHAATDTYRHSTANGSNTGTWDFYAELIGASVQQNPNHVDGTPLYDLSHIGTHPSTTNLPDPWAKAEEYYYWENGYYDPANIAVLMVEETVGPNDSVNTYDAPRPMSWYRELPEGGRVFYTALGHATSNYTTDTLFQAHVRDALTWLLEINSGLASVMPDGGYLPVWPTPASRVIHLMIPGECPEDRTVTISDANGRTRYARSIAGDRVEVSVEDWPAGLYVMRVSEAGRLRYGRFIVAR